MHQRPGFVSCAGGALLRLVLFLVIFAAIVTAAWIFFMPMLLTGTLSKRTGFDVSVQKLTFNPFTAEVSVQGLLVNNPHTFPRTEYLEIPEFHAKAPLRTLWSQNPVIDYVRINIQQITFVRNTDGVLNATLFYDRLFPVQKDPVRKPVPTPRPGSRNGEKRAPTPSPEPTRTPRERPTPDNAQFLIRRLEMRLQRVVTDDRYARTPVSKEFNLAIDQTFSDVTDPRQLFTPAVTRALSPVATAITGLIPGSLGDVLNSAVDTPIIGKDGKKRAAPDPIKSISDTLEESRKP